MLRLHTWRRRKRMILAMAFLGYITPAQATALIASLLIPNPWRHGDQVWQHTSLYHRAMAFQINTPSIFATDFILPNLDEIIRLAQNLRLPHVLVHPHGHRAERFEALLVYLLRLRKVCSMRDLARHSVLCFPGSNWSTTKVQNILRITAQTLHAIHRRRISWSNCCISRVATVYGPAMQNTAGPILQIMHPNLAALIDGTYRPIPRARPGPNGENLQRATFNGWLHGHYYTYQSLVTPDGLCASLMGPYVGTSNDRHKVNLSNIEAVWTALWPTYQILGDSGYKPFVPGLGNPIVRRPDGWPFPAGSPNALLSDEISRLRTPVEYPFGELLTEFPYLDMKRHAKLNTVMVLHFRNAVLLRNCLLCLKFGSREISAFYGDCPAPTLTQYLA